ncbi:MAG: hypothetical protein PUB55_09405, partial [Bacteroidales bacterium]|nr:hypothetical protein [Bacteroidales bacterium]
YPPGLSVLLVPGALLGVPHLMPPLLGGALVSVTYAFVREAYGVRQALLAAALLAVSPFLWCNAGTVMSFAPAALTMMAVISLLGFIV